MGRRLGPPQCLLLDVVEFGDGVGIGCFYMLGVVACVGTVGFGLGWV